MIDKWFALQAAAQRADTVDQVLKLAQHPDFVMTNPNRLRSLAGTFGANHWAFHSADGRGYAFLAEMIVAADKLNPQVAARLVPPFGRWRRLEPKRRDMMRQALERIAASPGLSKDVLRTGQRSRWRDVILTKVRMTASSRRSIARFAVATWFAAWLSARSDARRRCRRLAQSAVKRLVCTSLPPAVESDPSIRHDDLPGLRVITEPLAGRR